MMVFSLDTNGSYAIGGLSIVIGFFSIFVAFRFFRMEREIEDTPTSKVDSLAAGVVEIVGNVIPREALLAPYSRRPCVYYEYKLEELQVRREFDPVTKRWLIIKEWVTLKTERATKRFYLKDETGKVLVDPSGADVEDSRTFDQWFLRRRRRHTERIIQSFSNIYVLGTAADNPEKEYSDVASDIIMIRRGDVNKEFVISSKSEKQVALIYLVRFVLTLLLGIAMLAFGAWVIVFS